MLWQFSCEACNSWKASDLVASVLGILCHLVNYNNEKGKIALYRALGDVRACLACHHMHCKTEMNSVFIQCLEQPCHSTHYNLHLKIVFE